MEEVDEDGDREEEADEAEDGGSGSGEEEEADKAEGGGSGNREEEEADEAEGGGSGNGDEQESNRAVDEVVATEVMQPMEMCFPNTEYGKPVKIVTKCYVEKAIATINDVLELEELEWLH
ncbi:hypothetical protein AALP_AAs73735U000500 [Arabis alpina]|uniref:Uncharacterized protein n=1 Tax=Arabis alpina TaxID=50452 RepID=A0A087FWG9_ARAAL|nr:hypothetical protein AALP_AAs73735U000500 [Arabis alpina]